MWTQVIGQLAQFNQFKFQEDAESITVNAPKNVIDTIKQNISSRVTTREYMQNFVIQPSDDTSSIEFERDAENIVLKEFSAINNRDVFNRLFQDALVGSAIATTEGSIDWDDINSTDAILYSRTKVVTNRQLTVYKTQVQALQILLATTKLTTLRSAFSDMPMLEQDEDDTPGPMAGMANKVIGMTEEPENTNKKIVSLFFDCKRLLGLLTCFDYRQENDEELTLSKQSLIDFLSVSLPESVAITNPGRQFLIAEPKDSKALKVQHNFHMILDCSGSIGDLKKYFNKIASVVAKIGEIVPEQLIHTTLFDAKCEELLPMRADSGKIYLQQLLNKENDFGGQTYLDGTILKVISKIGLQILINDHYNSVLIITDGNDTNSCYEEKAKLDRCIQDFSKSINPPQFTFVQIGHETNRDFFDRFSKATCATSIDLEGPDSFEPLYNRIKDLTAEKGDIREFLDKQNNVLATVRPTLGELTPLNLKLPTSQFSFGKRGTPTKFNVI